MKLILDDKYVCDFDALTRIREVEAFGGWGARKYKIKGEPTRVVCVADGDVVEGKDAEAAENEAAAIALKRVESELAALKLSNAKTAAIARITAERRGLSAEDVEAYCAAQQLTFVLSAATSDDVRKWMRSKEATGAK